MKTTYKTICPAAAVLAIVLIAGFTSPKVGAVTPRVVSPPAGERSAAVCTRVASLKNTSESEIAARTAAMNDGFETRLRTLSANWQQNDQKANDFRTAVTTKFTDKVAALLQKPDLTDSQKAAVETYKAAMLADESARETAVDAARATYRKTVQDKITAYQAELSAAAAGFNGSITAAFQTAGETCTDGDATLQTLRTSVKAARAAFKTTLDKAGARGAIEQAATLRRSAVKTADDAFRQSAAERSRILADALRQAP